MTRKEVFNRIAKQVGKQPISCNCEKCKQMCQRTPCLGTPHDILALIEAGYIDKVCYTEWAAGMALGHTRQPIPMVQLKSTGSKVDGCCICYHDGKCELHENGLKPTEGKLAHHEVSAMELRPEYNLTYQVAIEWTKEENSDVIGEIVNKVMEHLNKKENE
jgi:hypothetical protein